MIAEKSRAVAAAAQATGFGQESLGGLERLLAATPHEGMTRDAGLTLWAQAAVQNQIDIDKAKYYAGFDQAAEAAGGLSRAFAPERAEQAFWVDHPTSSYEADRRHLAEMAKQPQFTKWLELLQSGDPRKSQQTAKIIDGLWPGMSRYLTGAQ